MTSDFTRGACPRLSEPMQTGDGLLARIVTVGPIPLDQFALLCAAAREHGNGVMEISARGSLQVRGLTPISAPLFASAVADLAIALCDDVPVLAGPLAGDPASLIDADALARDLRRVIAERNLTLAPKTSVIVDSGGSLHLDALAADIRLRAISTAAETMLHVALGGGGASATPLGLAAQDAAVEIVSDLLAAIAALGPEARAGDLLRDNGIGRLWAALGTRIVPAAPLPMRPPAEPIAVHRLKSGTCALGLGVAFGHAQAEALVELASIAEANGARWVRLAPDRALLLGPLVEAKAVAVRKAAERLGFIVDARDPRRRIVACPGAPSCTSGLIAARSIAAELAPNLPAALSVVHVSGCAKGCAHPAPAPLTIVGTSQGCGIVRDGTARDMSEIYVAADNLPALLSRLTKTREAAHA
jgi:precorrin-3B synthase